MEDILNYEGLIDAYKHYDDTYETKFSTFAYYYIVGEVNKYIRESSSLKVSRSLIELKNKVLKVKEIMTQKLGREPSNLEISLYLEVDENLIDEAIVSTDEVSSLDEVYNVGDYDKVSADILDLRNEIDKLPDDEKKLILSRYYNDMTQSETSNLLGISQVQVSRNENKILKKLKTSL